MKMRKDRSEGAIEPETGPSMLSGAGNPYDVAPGTARALLQAHEDLYRTRTEVTQLQERNGQLEAEREAGKARSEKLAKGYNNPIDNRKTLSIALLVGIALSIGGARLYEAQKAEPAHEVATTQQATSGPAYDEATAQRVMPSEPFREGMGPNGQIYIDPRRIKPGENGEQVLDLSDLMK